MICTIRDVEWCAHTKSLLTQQFQSEAWDLICMYIIVHILVSTYLFLLTSFFDCLSFCGLFLKHPYKRFFSVLYSLFLPIEISLVSLYLSAVSAFFSLLCLSLLSPLSLSLFLCSFLSHSLSISLSLFLSHTFSFHITVSSVEYHFISVTGLKT